MRYLLLLLVITSCTKVITKPLETTIDSESIVVAPNPIQGTWYPTIACRVTLKEQIIITDSTFTWVMDKFSTTYYDIISGLNAAPCINLILTTTVDWGCVLALVIGS
jgi:hypothetical protein